MFQQFSEENETETSKLYVRVQKIPFYLVDKEAIILVFILG